MCPRDFSSAKIANFIHPQIGKVVVTAYRPNISEMSRFANWCLFRQFVRTSKECSLYILESPKLQPAHVLHNLCYDVFDVSSLFDVSDMYFARRSLCKSFSRFNEHLRNSGNDPGA